jgi:hypothetical protein
MTKDTTTARNSTNGNIEQGGVEKVAPETIGITMDERVDLAVAVAVVLFGVLILILSQDIRRGSIPDPVTSRGLPNITGIFLVVAGVVLAVRQLLTWSALPGHLVPGDGGQEDEKGYPASPVRTLGIILLGALWAWLLKPLGILIITPLCLFVASLVMNEKSWGQIIAFSIIFPVSVWLIFGPLLGIRFPLGPLAPVVRSLGLIM